MALALVVLATPLLADDVSSSNTLLCSVAQATVCFAEGDCISGPPWNWNIPHFIEVDLDDKMLSTTQASGESRSTPIKSKERSDGMIFLQGIEAGRAFSLVIAENTGMVSFAVARDGLSVSRFRRLHASSRIEMIRVSRGGVEMKPMIAVAILIVLVVGSLAVAQTTGLAEPTGQKTLAATMSVFVFPNEGQAPDQQSKDEADCYNWAVQNTGTDPFSLVKQSEEQQAQSDQAMQQAEQVGQGAGAKGAVGGAAAGALIGGIANDDAGKGAAYGAAAGVIAGRRRGRQAQQQATAQVEQQSQQAQAATQEQITNFKKAFSVCLEAKDYMVKY